MKNWILALGFILISALQAQAQTWVGHYKLLNQENSKAIICSDLTIAALPAPCDGYSVSGILNVNGAELQFCKLNKGKQRINLHYDITQPTMIFSFNEVNVQTNSVLQKIWNVTAQSLAITGGALNQGELNFSLSGLQLELDYKRSGLDSDGDPYKILTTCEFVKVN